MDDLGISTLFWIGRRRILPVQINKSPQVRHCLSSVKSIMHRARQAHTARRARQGLPPSGGQAENCAGLQCREFSLARKLVPRYCLPPGDPSKPGSECSLERRMRNLADLRPSAEDDRGRGQENRNEPGNPAWRIDARSGSFGRGSPWRGLAPSALAQSPARIGPPVSATACPDAAAPKSAPDVAGPGPGHWTARKPVSRPGHPCGQVARAGRAYCSEQLPELAVPLSLPNALRLALLANLDVRQSDEVVNQARASLLPAGGLGSQLESRQHVHPSRRQHPEDRRQHHPGQPRFTICRRRSLTDIAGKRRLLRANSGSSRGRCE